MVREAVPSDFELRSSESTAEIRSSKIQDDRARLEIFYRAVLVPRIDTDEVKRRIAGKHPNVAKTYLESLPNFIQADIEITPRQLPKRLQKFPRKIENISVDIRIKEQ